MSRSFKLPIYKDKGYKSKYWKWIRSRLNTELKTQLYKDLDILELPNPKTLINDYNYSDYTFDYRDFINYKKKYKLSKCIYYKDFWNNEITNKMSRK